MRRSTSQDRTIASPSLGLPPISERGIQKTRRARVPGPAPRRAVQVPRAGENRDKTPATFPATPARPNRPKPDRLPPDLCAEVVPQYDGDGLATPPASGEREVSRRVQ